MTKNYMYFSKNGFNFATIILYILSVYDNVIISLILSYNTPNMKIQIDKRMYKNK